MRPPAFGAPRTTNSDPFVRGAVGTYNASHHDATPAMLHVLRTLALLMLIPAAVAAQSPPTENGAVWIGDADRPRSTPETLPDQSDAAPLLVTIDTPYQVFADTGTLLHVAAWTPDGRPAARADVYLAETYVGRTDETGTFVVRWGVPGNDVESYWREGSRVTVVYDDDGEVRRGSVFFSAYSRTESFASDHLYVYTDRGIYAPGDQLEARLIAWHLADDFAPVEGGEVELTLVSDAGVAVAGQNVTTDDFGTAAVSLDIPATLQDGGYRLEVAYESAHASTRLRIERFVAPAIRIDHTLGRFLTRDAGALAWDVELGYFAGGAPERATLTTEIVVYGEVRHRQVDGLDGAGPHTIAVPDDAFDALFRSLHDRATVSVRMTVEDDDGRIDTLTRDLTYAINPYVVVIESDRDAWSTGDPIELMVRATDVERVPLRDTVLRLTRSDGDTLEARTDEGGVAHFSLQMGENAIDVAVFIDGVDAALATRMLEWQQLQPMRSHIATPVVREREAATVSVRFPADFVPVERVVHMDVTDVSGALVNAVLLPIRETDQGFIAEGEFTAPSWGSMLLTFFCLGRDANAEPSTDGRATSLGLLTEGQNLAVHAGRELEIVLDGVPDDLAPGDTVSATIEVRDAQGARVDAALGLAMVDEAILSLRDPLEITPMDHFYNPELRVISTTGAAILTWPVVSRNWGPQTHDIALPPFPFKPGGTIEADGGEHRVQHGYGSGMAGAAAPSMAMGSVSGLGGGDMMMQAEAPMEEDMEAANVPLGGVMTDTLSTDRSDDRRARSDAPQLPEITIRTEMPETALWLPNLRAESGRARIELTAPDTLARHGISIVASDGHGGVGVTRAHLNVTQPFSVRIDAPATLPRGERASVPVTVTNRSDAPREVQVTLAGHNVVVGEVGVFRVPPGGSVTHTVEVEGTEAGPATLTATAVSGNDSDGAERPVFVAPSGALRIRLSTGFLGDEDWTVDVPDARADQEWREVALRVEFPAITSSFAGLEDLVDRLRTEDIDSLAGDLVTALLVYERMVQHDPGRADTMRGSLVAAVAHVAALQQDDGGWRPRWSDRSSAFITAWCLEALLEAQRIGLADHTSVIQSGAAFLAEAIASEEVDVGEIAFWEGDDAAVQRGLRAEMLYVLARVPPAIAGADVAEQVRDMVDAALPVLDEAAPDIMTFAHVLGAANALQARGETVLDRQALNAAVERLDSLRTEGHWEPSWFHAYGGTIEATATILQVLRDVDDAASQRVARGALRYALSTAPALGSWHNERGSAALLRVLALVGAPPEESAAEVVVFVDDAEVGRWVVDPADPYASTLALREVDLSAWLGDGGALRVEYSGALQPFVTLEDRVWGGS